MPKRYTLDLTMDSPLRGTHRVRANKGSYSQTGQSATLTYNSFSGLDSRTGDEAFMQAIYDSTNGSNWDNNTGWNDGAMSLADSPVGLTIETVGAELRITEVRMHNVTQLAGGCQDGNNLVGTLPPEVQNLKKCTYFNVKTNGFTGAIPSEIGGMTSLIWLSLGGQRKEIDLADHQWNENNHACTTTKAWEETNEFSGPIPSTIGNLTNLQLLEIRRQYLTGTIPPEIGNCTSLIGLFLNDSKGASPLGGELPPEMGNLSNLKHLHLDSRSNDAAAFTGDIPSEINLGLSELRHVRFRDNGFTGPVPEFPNSYDLRVYIMAHNEFTGGFPTGIFQGDHPLLNNFSVGANNLTGSLPTEDEVIFPTGKDNYNSMSKFTITDNNFTGPVPDWMQEMDDHQVVDIKNNSLSGGFPALVMDRGNLKTFLFSNNDFTGPLPVKAWASTRMLTIYAQSNGFTGPIPEEWSTLTTGEDRMLYFYLQDNELEGVIPSWLGNLGSILRIYLHDNKFTPKDIVPNLSAISAAASEIYSYTPQKPFGSASSYTAGQTIDLSAFAYTNNTYQWYKDDVVLSGETSNTIDTTSHGAGTYHMTIDHPNIAYTFTSTDQTVT